MNNTSRGKFIKAAVYLEKNYRLYYEWVNDNAATCKKFDLTNEELLEIVSFELANNRAISNAWKEILLTIVGLDDGVERTSINDFYKENCFSDSDICDVIACTPNNIVVRLKHGVESMSIEEYNLKTRFSNKDVYEAAMYASSTFSKHVVKNSHGDVIAYRFALQKQLHRTFGTPEENEHIAQILSYAGLSEDNAVYSFLSIPGLTLEKASKELNKSVEEIEEEFSQAVNFLENKCHSLFDKKVIAADSPDREAITQEILSKMKRLTPRQKAVTAYLFGIPENLDEQDFENVNNITLEEPHTYGEASEKFGIKVERVRQMVLNAIRKGSHPRRRERWRDYLD